MFTLPGQLTELGVGRKVGASLPAGLPASGLLKLWYAGDGTNQPAYISTTGSLVDAWATYDNALSLANTGSGRPTYAQSVAAFNNRGALSFDGAATYLYGSISGGIAINRTDFVIYVVCSAGVLGSNLVPYSEGYSGGNNPNLEVRKASTNTVVYVLVTNAGVSNSSGISFASMVLNQAHYLTLTRNSSAGTSAAAVDGDIDKTSSFALGTYTNANRVAIGAWLRSAASRYWSGYIACVAIYQDDSNKSTVQAALKSHYNTA